jgi:putative pyruvate formate lyase activating enzyme
MDLTPEELRGWYLKLQDVGQVHNVNLVTPEHVVPQVVLSILHAAEQGLRLPIVYNTSAYDSLESLELLDGLVDVYLPDFKAWEPETCKRLLKAEDYAVTARESVREMNRQVGDLCFTGDGLAKRGLLVRHLVMPGKEEEGEKIMRWLGEEVSRDVFVHVMDQYHPDAHVGKPKGRQRRRDGVSGEAEKKDEEEETESVGASTKSKVDPGGIRYAEINRAASQAEISSVRRAAEEAGLWRFCDPPGHDGFNI